MPQKRFTRVRREGKPTHKRAASLDGGEAPTLPVHPLIISRGVMFKGGIAYLDSAKVDRKRRRPGAELVNGNLTNPPNHTERHGGPASNSKK